MIIEAENKKLRVLGKVDLNQLSALMKKELFQDPNKLWVFADYSNDDIGKEFKFDFFQPQGGESMIEDFIVEISEVYDSFGHNLNGKIPKGSKTICQLSFLPSIPTHFHNLPVLKGWQSTTTAIDLIGLKNVKEKEYIDEQLLKTLSQILYVNDLSVYGNKLIDVNELQNHLLQKYMTTSLSTNLNNVMALLFAQGLIKHDANKEHLIIQKIA